MIKRLIRDRICLLGAVAWIVGLGVASAGAFAQEAAAQRPNVIIIVTDDQGFGDMGRAGEIDCNDPAADPAHCQHPLETALQAAGLESFTPNIDQLARESVQFSDFHVTPLCATTRAALMTGRFNQRTGVLFPGQDRQILDPRETTLAQRFKRAGYHTGMFGKWNLGDEYPSRPQDRGFDEALRTGGPSLSHTSDYWMNDCYGDTYFDEKDQAISFGPDNHPPQPGDRYCTDIFFGEATRFIADHLAKSPSQAFFVYIATTAPHSIPNGTGLVFAPPNDPDPSVLYESVGVEPVLADFYGAITGIDDNLGKLREFLRDTGLEENTILVFFGDNGSVLTIGNFGTAVDRSEKRNFLYGRFGIDSFDPGYSRFINPAGLRSWKGHLYEGGHRVFLSIRWPAGGVTSDRAQTIEALTHVADLFPTLLDLADVEIAPGSRKKLDGLSLESLLAGTSDSLFDQRTVLLQEAPGNQNTETGAFAPAEFENFAVLTPQWRLVHPGLSSSKLYDRSDRSQSVDLAAGNPDVVQELEAQWSDFYGSWIKLYDDAIDRGRIYIGSEDLPSQTLTAASWLLKGDNCSACVQYGILNNEGSEPERGFWALKILRDGAYSIKLRRWPTTALAPDGVVNQPIDPRGMGTARLVISPSYVDLQSLSLSEAGHNFIDLTNSIDSVQSESEFCVQLKAQTPRRRFARNRDPFLGLVFMGGELTGVSELAESCDVGVDPESCPAVVRSPYYAEVTYLGSGGCGG